MTEQGAFQLVLPGVVNLQALVRRSGKCDAEDFLRLLNDRYRARYLRYLQYLAAGIPIKSPENYRVLRKRDTHGILVAEIKVDKFRLYVINHDSHWYLSHGRDKPKDSQVVREVEKALNFYQQSLKG